MPRTCEWPADPDGVPGFRAGAPVTPCGTRVPSMVATQPGIEAGTDPTAQINVCNDHANDAAAAGWTVEPYVHRGSRSRTVADVMETGHEIVEAPAADVAAEAVAGPPALPTVYMISFDAHADPELDALHAISEAMRVLYDNDARRRVATWVADRYGAPI